MYLSIFFFEGMYPSKKIKFHFVGQQKTIIKFI